MKNRGGRPRNPVTLPEVPFQPRPEGGFTWYIGMVSPGAKPDKTRAVLVEKGYQAWCPLRLVERKHARQTTVVLDALWHPYLFVGLRATQGLAKVCEVKGMLDVVRTDSGYAVPLDVAILQKAWDQQHLHGGVFDHTSPEVGPWAAMKEGAPLRVVDGPFEGFPATFSRVDGDRIKILVDVFGRKTPISVTPNQVSRDG